MRKCYYCRAVRLRLVMTGKSNGTWWCRNQARCMRRYDRRAGTWAATTSGPGLTWAPRREVTP